MSDVLNTFLEQVRSGQPVEFQDTMDVIAAHYDYTPTRFCNGLGVDPQVNEAGTNEGSCRIFAFASLHCLDVTETLALFGRYYREDVLGHPEALDHRNIRQFMQDGWAGIVFDGKPLRMK